MSDRLTLVEPQERQIGPSRKRGFADTALDKLNLFALGLVLVGLVFSAIGFLYPREVRRDPQASARENEEADLEFMRLTDALNAVIFTGMVLIGLGGLIISAVFMNSVVCQECQQNDVGRRHMTSQPVRSPPPPLADSGHPAQMTSPNYGTVSDAVAR